MAALPLGELRTHLSPQEEAFFDHLDAQLEKVESFYSAREGEMIARTALLQQQLLELQDHSRAIHVGFPKQSSLTMSHLFYLFSKKQILGIHGLPGSQLRSKSNLDPIQQ